VPGTGLGLTIARRALALHGGDIRATPRTGGGLLVIARLPASRVSANVIRPVEPAL
jgi:signal transduction histidine kinase